MSRLPLVAAVTIAAMAGSARPEEFRPQEPPQRFPTTVERVVLDMVVRDKSGRVVTDLRQDEVEVLEDGQPCRIESFRLVQAGVEDPARATNGAAPSSGAMSAPGASAIREPLVVLVFDRLSAEGSVVAQSAATEFVKRPFPPGTWLAVLDFGRGLQMTVSLTQDLGRVRQAIAATTGNGAGEPAQGDQGGATREAMTAALVATADPVGVEGLDPAAAAKIRAASGPVELKRNEIEARILTEVDSLRRQKLGQDSLYALQAIASALSGVEGRKTLVYFSEGLTVPDVVADVLERTVSQANRANLTVYAVDPRGLVTDSASDESKRALLAARHASERAMRSTGLEEGPNRGVSPLEAKTHDLALDTLRLDPQANLRELAESTGGLLVANTNDLSAAIERVGSELRSYHEIGYVPANPVADGAFREIEVKVRRRGASVRARRGYLALPPGQAPTFPHELALAQALGEPELPRDFTHDVATSIGAGGDGGRQVELVVRVLVGNLRLETEEATGTFRAHFSVLVAVRDAAGAVVAKLSHDWPLSGPSSAAAQARRQNAAVRRTLTLPAGHYVVETAVLDRLSGARSARRTSLDVRS